MKKTSTLLPLVKKYFEKDTLSAVRSLEAMPEEEAISVLRELPSSLAAKAFPLLQTTYAATLIQELSTGKFKDILEKIEPYQGAAIFLQLPNDIREKMISELPEKLRHEIREFLTYPEESAGRLMTTNFISFHSDIKVKDVIQKIRNMAQRQIPVSYAYVIDSENHLVGVINMRDLLIASPEVTLETIMVKDIYTINAFTDREQLVQDLGKRKFFAVPVVDFENHLLGILHVEKLLKGIQEEGTEDILKMFGAGGDERINSSMFHSIKKRLPWLFVNLATAFLAASVVATFESIIAQITVLAVFLPVVAGQGGNAGSQSLAIVMRGIVMREIKKGQGIKLIFKEGFMGIITGITTGAVTGAIAWVWFKKPYLGLVVFLGMVVNLIAAGLFGAAIPQIMKKIGQDPAQCSTIILTTITDVVGFMAFLGFAVIFKSYLI